MSTYTVDLRLRALGRANDIRLARADLRHRIFAGDITVASVLLDSPPEACTWPVRDLLASQRRWGRSRTLKLLSRNRISESKPVGDLTDRQRWVLAGALAEEGGTAVKSSPEYVILRGASAEEFCAEPCTAAGEGEG